MSNTLNPPPGEASPEPAPVVDIAALRKKHEEAKEAEHASEGEVAIWNMTPEQLIAESTAIKQNMVKRKSTEV